jgi:preprotein translocase subunit SecY
MIGTAVAIIPLALLYTAFVLDPEETARKLKRYGVEIPGVEPGEATAAHIDFVVSRTATFGTAYLVLVALVPQFLLAFTPLPFYFGGVSALIVVCVVLDIGAQVRGDGLVNSGG